MARARRRPCGRAARGGSNRCERRCGSTFARGAAHALLAGGRAVALVVVDQRHDDRLRRDVAVLPHQLARRGGVVLAVDRRAAKRAVREAHGARAAVDAVDGDVHLLLGVAHYDVLRRQVEGAREVVVDDRHACDGRHLIELRATAAGLVQRDAGASTMGRPRTLCPRSAQSPRPPLWAPDACRVSRPRTRAREMCGTAATVVDDGDRELGSQLARGKLDHARHRDVILRRDRRVVVRLVRDGEGKIGRPLPQELQRDGARRLDDGVRVVREAHSRVVRHQIRGARRVCEFDHHVRRRARVGRGRDAPAPRDLRGRASVWGGRHAARACAARRRAGETDARLCLVRRPGAARAHAARAAPHEGRRRMTSAILAIEPRMSCFRRPTVVGVAVISRVAATR
eukprot:960406-Prymnesium_polylepis.2